ncbi:MAG: hypothetical protein Unbinned97contig1000_33 [Prokaryotic dsDNA virus sp.]|nr:MAG: hypothetical protein Unbinned97contig1000_33 [Prokaryotic dsDNA virus sp.]
MRKIYINCQRKKSNYDDIDEGGHGNWDGQSPHNDAGESMMTASQYLKSCQADNDDMNDYYPYDM